MTELKGDFPRARVAASLLMTLPGFPFIYYGEEIGMTGSKPDPRLRTPMHWKRAPAAGFTRGVAWEPLQPDSMTANVEAQDANAASLLNLYRALIHLRANNPALGEGDFIPLSTGQDGIAAYLRRKDNRYAVIVANLTATRMNGIALSSAKLALPAGRYVAKGVLGNSGQAPLIVDQSGAISNWIPLPSVDALAVNIFDISRQH
jgi:glycosidase